MAESTIGTFFITGASSGFGAATARQVVAAGGRVVAAARRVERLSALAAELGKERLLPVALDVRDRASVEAAVAALPRGFDVIDTLVNNAGLAGGGTSSTSARWRGRTRTPEATCTARPRRSCISSA